MAVVFISPKKRQKTFFVIITFMFLIFLSLISLGVFLAKPAAVSPTVVFNKAKISIDMSIFDSNKFKNLQPTVDMGTQYSYKATNKSNRALTGFISADSIDDAKTALQALGLTVNTLKELQIGRDNPFTPYYQVVAPPVTSPATSTTTSTTTTPATDSTTTGAPVVAK